jgi:anti-anti-sigma factor
VTLRVLSPQTDSFLHCWTEEVPEAVVLHAEDELDLNTALVLANAVTGAFEQRECVIVDLSHLDHLDFSGAHVLEHTAARYDGRFAIVQGSKPTIHKIFDILELTDFLPVIASIEAAQEYFRKGE